MREVKENRATKAASALSLPARAAGQAIVMGAQAWRRTAGLSKAHALVIACVGAAGLALTLFAHWWAWVALGEARAASAWGRAPAVILATSVEHGCGGDPDAYETRIRYRYDVAGASHIGDRLYLDSAPCSSERAARSTAARHPVDSKATVRYDPVRVSQSALSVGESTWAAWLGVLATGAIATACALCSGRGLHALLSNATPPWRRAKT